jgi:hypothetical protein
MAIRSVASFCACTACRPIADHSIVLRPVHMALSYLRSSGTIALWNGFWDNYIEWEVEPAGSSPNVNTLRKIAQIFALSARSARCVSIVCPGGGLVVSAQGSERFAVEIRNATVVNLDSDHYACLSTHSQATPLSVSCERKCCERGCQHAKVRRVWPDHVPRLSVSREPRPRW